MDDDTNKKDQPNSIKSYQDILDQYAASVKSDPETEIEKEPKETADPQEFLEEVNLPPTPEPIIETPTPIVPPIIPPALPISEPILPPISPVSETPQMPVFDAPEKTTEQIKEEVNKILTDDTANSTIPPTKSGLNLYKIFFIISLLIFLSVAATLAYMLLLNPNSKNNPSTNSSVTPTISNNVVCELNGSEYAQGQSFPSADGCNTCTCESPNMIACTEKACAPTPTVMATKSAIKTTPTPTKSATSSSLPKKI